LPNWPPSLKNINVVLVEQMDGTENEAEGLKLEGFPTLLFYPANNKKEPIEFSGERTVRTAASLCSGACGRCDPWDACWC
jgi:hypothetical protein